MNLGLARRAALLATFFLGLVGCNQLLGIHELSDDPQDGASISPPPKADASVDASVDAKGAPVSRDAGAQDASQEAAVPECPTGQHTCPGGCVSDSDIRTCGPSCTPCQAPIDGTATCDGKACGGACPTGKQLCLGMCIDARVACVGTCPDGQHACGGLCVSVLDVNACGTSCSPCPVPTGASQATCSATGCDFQCLTGAHQCGARCASDNDATACGMACTICPTDPNGTAVCAGGNCGVLCAIGYHLCSGRCVTNQNVDSCGTLSCKTCPTPVGGTVTCDGTGCVNACPSGMKLCVGTCIDAATACSGVCPTGTHNCDGICAPSDSVDSCGTACASCTKPTGASTTSCDGTSCGFTCGPGFHRCGNRCAADDDATACGTSCVNCPTDPNGSAACVGGTCGTLCKSAFHQCPPSTGPCVDNKSLANCGSTSCSACQAPMGGTVGCDGLACATACPSGMKVCAGVCIANGNACNGACPTGTHNCAGICQPDTSATFCGTACANCPAPASNGSAVCSGGACAVTCSSTFRQCPGTTTCVASPGGCCSDTDCTSGPAHTTGVCGSAHTCSYPCATDFRMCSGSTTCISATSTCCGDIDCTRPNTCGGGGTANVCGCTTETDMQFCSRLAKTCSFTGLDNCGASRTVNCGTCTNQACVAGVCTGACIPGAKRCSSTTLQTCDQNGAFSILMPCDDGDACTTNSCTNNACAFGARTACTSPPGPCKMLPGSCNATSGQCDYANRAGSCDLDSNACTQDTCLNGACAAGPTTSCLVNDCNTGCAPATGMCVQKANNTACTSLRFGGCQNGTCQCYQNLTFACSSGAPTCLGWSFESGTSEGWIVNPDVNATDPGAVTNLSVRAPPQSNATGAFALSYQFNGAASGRGTVSVPLCNPGGALLDGRTFHFAMYFVDGPNQTTPFGGSVFWAHTDTSGAVGFVTAGPLEMPVTSNTWIHYSVVLDQGALGATGITVFVVNPWTGTVYVDDVRIE
jgi:hypothetical protein